MSRTRSVGVTLAVLTPARLVLNSAHRFVYPFLPVIARGLGISLESAGALVAARWGVGMTTPLVVRGVGPEHRRRLILTGLWLFSVGAVVTAATSVWVGALFGFAAMGLAKSTFDVSAQAHIADRVPYQRRGRALAVMELTWAGGFLVGAPFAGWLIDRSGWQAPFWVLAGFGAASVVAVMVLIPHDGEVAGRITGRLDLDRSSFSLLVLMAMFSGASELMFTSLGAWLEGSFGLSILVIGGVATILGLAELTGEGSVLLITDRLGKRRAVAVGLALAALGYAGTGVFNAGLVLGLGFFALALAAFEFTIVSAIPLATEVQPQARTQFLSLGILAMGAGRAIGALFGPRLYEAFGVAANAWVASLCNIAGLLLLFALVEEGHTASVTENVP